MRITSIFVNVLNNISLPNDTLDQHVGNIIDGYKFSIPYPGNIEEISKNCWIQNMAYNLKLSQIFENSDDKLWLESERVINYLLLGYGY
jgi:hypothetical protein